MSASLRHHSSVCEFMLYGQVLIPGKNVAEPEGLGVLLGHWV